MKTSCIEIETSLARSFGDVRIIWFVAEDLGRFSRGNAAAKLVGEVQGALANTLTPEQVGQLPIIAPWRAAFAKQGIKPSQFRSSAEALVRRFASGKYNSVGIALVDAYNAISAKHQIPMGAYDLAKMGSPNISLRFARANDLFHPLGGKSEDYLISEKVPVYAIGPQVICWCFNHRDSRDTCVDHNSQSVLFVSEAIDKCQYDSQSSAIAELRKLLIDEGARLSASHLVGNAPQENLANQTASNR